MNPQLVLSIHGAFENLFNEYTSWAQRGFASPSPHFVKQAYVVRNGIPNATWIETGTFMGQTTEILATHAEKVSSIEPER